MFWIGLLLFVFLCIPNWLTLRHLTKDKWDIVLISVIENGLALMIADGLSKTLYLFHASRQTVEVVDLILFVILYILLISFHRKLPSLLHKK